jgi:thiamine biosynthesis lipoprotein
MRRVLVPLDVAPALRLRTPRGEVASLGGETMGTTWSVKSVLPAHVSVESLRVGIETVLDGVIAQMSPWIEDSNISIFNRAPAGSWHLLPDDFLTVLRYALSIAEASGGAYDPTAGALVDLWGFGPHGRPGVIPSDRDVKEAVASAGWRRVRLEGSRALQPGGVRLDLSSIAKGFAVDKVSAFLAQHGVFDQLVEIGGELRGHGTKPGGDPWWVAIEELRGAGAPETVVALHDLSIATSGDAQRYFDTDGRRYSHTIDPRTGKPVSGDVASVTVLHKRCMYADALATAFLVLGKEEGFALATRLNVAARFLARVPRWEARMTPEMVMMLN